GAAVRERPDGPPVPSRNRLGHGYGPPPGTPPTFLARSSPRSRRRRPRTAARPRSPTGPRWSRTPAAAQPLPAPDPDDVAAPAQAARPPAPSGYVASQVPRLATTQTQPSATRRSPRPQPATTSPSTPDRRTPRAPRT